MGDGGNPIAVAIAPIILAPSALLREAAKLDARDGVAVSDLVASDAAKEALPFTRAGAHEAVAFLIDDPLPHEAAGAERASDELAPNRCLYKDFANCICRMASGPISAAVQYQPLGEARRRRSWPRGRTDRERSKVNVINNL